MLELPEGCFGTPGFPRSENVKLIGIEILEEEDNFYIRGRKKMRKLKSYSNIYYSQE
jgi:hypothetical protein